MKLLRHLLILLAVTCFLNVSKGLTQSNGIIADQDTKLPIADVHIIITNSSLSTYSNSRGKYSVNEKAAQGLTIVYSHINYEIYTLNLEIGEHLPDTVFLALQPQELATVTVKAERSELRKARLKYFTEDLFKSDNPRVNKVSKISKLKNPESVWFEMKGDSLNATSKKLLKINNPFLGYDLLFLLEYYSRPEAGAKLSGKAMFAEVNENGPSNKHLKRRNELWERGLQRFLGHLLSTSISSSNFKCYVEDPVHSAKGYYELRKADTYVDFIKKTVIDDVYAFICPTKIHVHYKQNISTLFSSSGIILFNKNGIILNKEEVIVDGYWARLSLTELIPKDFRAFQYDLYPIPRFERSYAVGELKRLASSINEASSDLFCQEITLETDRLLYSRFDDIFIQGFNYDHNSNSYSPENELITLELIDTSGYIILRKTTLAENGFYSTGFKIPDNLNPGQYIIRARSDFLENYGEAALPYKTIGISTSYTDLTALNPANQVVYLEFFPEGGHLVADQENIVLLLAKNDLGIPVDFEGTLEILGKQDRLPLKTLQSGIGSFTITPSIGDQFSAHSSKQVDLHFNAKELLVSDIPAIKVQSRDPEFFNVSVLSKNEIKRHTLNIRYKENIIYSITDIQPNQRYKVSKSYLPKGIQELQLINQNGRKISQRLIDNSTLIPNILEANFNYAFYYPNQEGEITMEPQVSSIDGLEDLLWNVKLTHEEYSPLKDKNDSYLLPQQSQAKLSRNELSEKNYAWLRNLELISKTINPTYSIKYSFKESDIKFQRKELQSIKGQIFNRFNSKPVPGRVSITKMDENFYYVEIDTDEDGIFIFNGLPFDSTSTFVIQARMKLEEGEEILEGNRNVIIEIDSSYNRDTFTTQKFYILPELEAKFESIEADSTANNAFSLSKELDEITVLARKYNIHNNSDMYNLNDEDWLPDETTGIDILRRLYPGKRWRQNPDNPIRMQVLVTKGQLFATFFDVTYVINGQAYETPFVFNNIQADQLAYVGLLGNIVVAVTNPGFKLRSETEAEKYGILQYRIEENKVEVDIESINLESSAAPEVDNRKTLLMKSGWSFDPSERNTLKFKTSSIAGKYILSMFTIHPSYGPIRYEYKMEVREEGE